MNGKSLKDILFAFIRYILDSIASSITGSIAGNKNRDSSKADNDHAFGNDGSRTYDRSNKGKFWKSNDFDYVDGEYSEVVDDPQKSEAANEEAPGEEEKIDYQIDLEHIQVISSSLYKICNMDIRNAGMRALRMIKDIVKEKYEDNNSVKGFAQFERYYLPVFRDNVEKYSIMEEKGVVSKKIQDDMLAYLNSCEKAFSKMYNSMFDEDILKMEVQMKAMDITLKRDGLL